MKTVWILLTVALVLWGQEPARSKDEEPQNASVIDVFINAAVLKPRGFGMTPWVSDANWLMKLVELKKDDFGIDAEEWKRIQRSYRKPGASPGFDGRLEELVYELMGADCCRKFSPYLLEEEGLAACTRQCLKQLLGLDETQHAKISEINQKAFEEFTQPYGQMIYLNSDPLARVSAATAAREKSKQVDREILEVLNDEQRKKLEPLLLEALKIIDNEEFGQAK